jgi:heat shock protein HslJ/LysM repeat protein
MKTLPIILLTLTLLLLPAVALAHPAGSGQAQEPVACELDYTVQVGDWLSKLADKYYGDVLAYPAIVAATNAQTDEAYATIENPDLIEPGWTLCIPSAEDAATLMASSAMAGPQTGGEAPAGLSQQDLANATYTSEFTQAGTATLVDGEYSEAAAPGSATQTVVTLTPYVAYGQIDGQDVAAVVLVTDPGGSGTFYTLHLMTTQDGEPVEVSSTSLGDRVQINSITIEDNQIVVDMVQAGPDDPMCCPSQQVIKTYAVQDGQLVEVSSQEVTEGKAEAPSQGLAGTAWILTTLNGAEPLPDTTITASFDADGTLNGTDGCNRYGAVYEVDGNNISITLGPATLMACPEPIMNQATEYLTALEAAATYQIQGEVLELQDADGNVVATFSAQPTGLAGTSWDVIAYNNGRGGVVSVIIGTEITAVFGEDGNLTGNAGCNDYSAPYEADDQGNISIGPAVTTFMECSEPEGIMGQEQEYLAALETAATYRVEGDTMEMRTAEDSQVASFKLAP